MTDTKATPLTQQLEAAQNALYALPPSNDDDVSAKKDILSARIGRLKAEIAKSKPTCTEPSEQALIAAKVVLYPFRLLMTDADKQIKDAAGVIDEAFEQPPLTELESKLLAELRDSLYEHRYKPMPIATTEEWIGKIDAVIRAAEEKTK